MRNGLKLTLIALGAFALAHDGEIHVEKIKETLEYPCGLTTCTYEGVTDFNVTLTYPTELQPAVDVPVDPPVMPPRPSTYRGVPERPFAGVATGIATVETGATQCIGTAEQPAFMVGGSISEKYFVLLQNCIVDGLNATASVKVEGDSFNYELRNIEVAGSDRAGVQLSGNNGALVNSRVHHARRANGHAVQVRCGSSNIWIGENRFEYNDEDAFQAGHRCDGSEPDALYFYGNTCVSNREDCWDSKHARRLVVSGNRSRDHRLAQRGVAFQYDNGIVGATVNSGSDGTAYLVGSDGGPDTVFMFDNVSENDRICVRVESGVSIHIDNQTCVDTGVTFFKFDKRGHTHITNSNLSGGAVFLDTTWRNGIHVSESGNVYDGVYREGNSGTVDNNPADINDAYRAAFGREP